MSLTTHEPPVAANLTVGWPKMATARAKAYLIRTSAIAVAISLSMSLPGQASTPESVREATIQPDTKAQLILQSQINSKLSEAGDVITATLAEPIYVEGEMVLARGTEFHGRIVAIAPAKRGQRNSHMSINFDRVVTASGSVPVSAQVTAIDDWNNEVTIKADDQGKLKGGRQGQKTIDNMRKGTSLGFSAGFVGLMLGGAAGASGRQALGIGGKGMAAGMIGGILLTKGGEIRVAQGSILRIRFLSPASIPMVSQPGPIRNSDELSATTVNQSDEQMSRRLSSLRPSDGSISNTGSSPQTRQSTVQRTGGAYV